MGTTLTGTTPQDTYDSLIKVTDNGALSGTAKYLSDGLGNDSVLALSTTALGLGTTTPTALLTVAGTSDLAWSATTSKLQISRSSTVARLQNYEGGSAASLALQWDGGNVGIGISSPAATLEVKGGTSGFRAITSSATTATFSMLTDLGLGYDNAAQLIAGQSSTNNAHLIFATKSSGLITEKVRILSTGGITFNGDTAAANALDDYEEGTWTITATPQSSGTITLGTNGGTYTKIGRQVTCTAFCILSSVSSPVGSYVQFGGLPFTTLNSAAARASVSLYFADASAGYASYVLPSYAPNNLTVFYGFLDVSTLAANDEFTVTITYFV